MEPREARDKVRCLASATVKVTKAEEVMLFLILLFYAEVDWLDFGGKMSDYNVQQKWARKEILKTLKEKRRDEIIR